MISRHLAGNWKFDAAALGIFAVAAACLLATAPINGDFSWSDAPRHALNGAFLKDFLAAMPVTDPVQWAMNYYLQYPALTILFYPPLFYGFEAMSYALFGFSHFSAQFTVTIFDFLLAWGGYLIARSWLPRGEAVASGLLLVAAPEIAFWGRQVMLDIPAIAGVAFSTHFFIRYLKTERLLQLFFALAFMLGAIYTKYDVVFIAPVFGLTLIVEKGWRILLNKGVLLSTGGFVLAMVPALALTLRFGAVNVQSVGGRVGDTPIGSLEAWLYYPSHLPQMLGWPAFVLAGIGLAVVLLARPPELERGVARLMLYWLLAGYLFFSAIGVREPRHFLPVLVPLVFLASAAIHRLAPAARSAPLACALALGTFVYSLFLYPPPAVAGYKEVADYVADHAAQNTIVLFSGYRDGNFVFNIRAREDRRDLFVVRADKLLLRISVERERGVGQVGLSEEQIATLLRDLGVGLIVVQPGFFEDLREMQRFAAVLKRPDFERVATFPITAPGTHEDLEIQIFRPTYAVVPHRQKLELEIPLFGGSMRGEIGH